jgi:hypothetical protein
MAALDLSSIIPLAILGAFFGLAVDLWKRVWNIPEKAQDDNVEEVSTTELKRDQERPFPIAPVENKWAPPLQGTDAATRIVEEVVDQKPTRPDNNEPTESLKRLPANLSETKKMFLAGGIFVLCLLSLLWTEGYKDRKVIGLTELVALIGAWTCLIWLWNQGKVHHFAVRSFNGTRNIGSRIWPLISKFTYRAFYPAVFVIIAMVFYKVGPWYALQMQKIERDKGDVNRWTTHKTQTDYDKFTANSAKKRLEEAMKNGGKDFQERISRLENEWLNYVEQKSRGELIDYERPKSREEWIIEQIVNGR